LKVEEEVVPHSQDGILGSNTLENGKGVLLAVEEEEEEEEPPLPPTLVVSCLLSILSAASISE
jgi:hypothetical protein